MNLSLNIGRSLVLVATLFLASCNKDTETISEFKLNNPAHFPDVTYNLESNPLSEKAFKLGRELFYDPILSLDNSVSCSNCHQQGTAFADGQQHPFSIGVDNEIGKRNAPMLANLAFQKEFFWDGGVTHLDFVPINAIESEIEMKEQLANVINKLNQNEEYVAQFKAAFDIDSISSPYLLKALSQFMLMMISDNSTYDKWYTGRGSLTPTQHNGRLLFEQKCSTCHSGVLFTDMSYKNTGLDSVYTDKGRGEISEDPNDDGKFRVPSLRNVTLTAPYMHNARFQTLKEVLDHYDEGVLDVPNLADDLRVGGNVGISLTENEKELIIEFLKTLTDYDFIQNQEFVVYH